MQKQKILVVALLLSLSLRSFAHQVIAIDDGDSLTLLVNERPVEINLANIDAPERRQPWGYRSRNSLVELCWGSDAVYETLYVNQHKQVMAVVQCAGVNVNRVQVDRGVAWVHPDHNIDVALPGLEAVARAERRGLWSDKNPVPPWEFKHKSR